VVTALLLGGLLAFLVLFLFLRQPRYPVAVALAIPISVIGTFALMDAFGVSLNIMSLGGLALGVGMLVDNSIIVLENIFRHQQAGLDARRAASEGAREVAGAITAATLTTIAVFGPIVYVEGVAGELFRDLSLAVTFSLLVSLLVALTLLPVVAARFRAEPRPARLGPVPLVAVPRPVGVVPAAAWLARATWRLPIWLLRVAGAVAGQLLAFWWASIRGGAGALFRRPLDAFDRGFSRFAEHYHRALEWSLDRRGVVLGLAAVALVGAAAVGLALDRDLLPRVDQGSFEVRLELPGGTALDRTDEVARDVEAVLLADPDVDAVFGHVGRDARRFAASDQAVGLHTAVFQVRLRDGTQTTPVVDRLRAPLGVAAADGVLTIQTGQATALGQLLGGSDADIAVRIRGQDLDRAMEYAGELAARLVAADRLTNLRVGTQRGHAQYEATILRDEAARFNLQPSQVAEAIEHGMRGLLATEFVVFDRKVPVVVRLPDRLRHDRATLDQLLVSGVPIREVAAIDLGVGPAEIRREEQGRVVTVLADVRGGGLDRAIAQVDAMLAAVPAPTGLRVEVGGENEEMRRSFRDLAFAFGLALFLVYMILAAQFESFVRPLTILTAVPLALIGAVLALGLAGQGLNTMSLIGVVILIGIVVNDAIVKVDFIVQALERGRGLRESIVEAGRVRLRPILMTTATTVLGLTPMALGVGRGADLRAPLAIAVIGGLIVATALTLIIVPVLFSVIEELRPGRVRQRRVREVAAGEPTRPEPGAGEPAVAGLASTRSRA
jgi:hydrophobic/amphiphilic exporter-1 (mainly G- bacteria), HAE1 family